MNEQVTFDVNDTYRDIQRVIDQLRAWESPFCDARIKALILTDLERAQLWALKLVQPVTP